MSCVPHCRHVDSSMSLSGPSDGPHMCQMQSGDGTAGFSRERSCARHQACLCGLQAPYCHVLSFRWQSLLQHQQWFVPANSQPPTMGSSPLLPHHQVGGPGCAGADARHFLSSLP